MCRLNDTTVFTEETHPSAPQGRSPFSAFRLGSHQYRSFATKERTILCEEAERESLEGSLAKMGNFFPIVEKSETWWIPIPKGLFLSNYLLD